ncbi:MAG: prolipoprotein diacylglyceryl transferase [Clostridia bacterium]|nr:prolipoprotein diacylglyceryl transferase [Clostridia bacterium]
MDAIPFVLIFGGGLLLSAWLFHLILAREGEKRRLAWLTLAIGLVTGYILSKGVYVLFRMDVFADLGLGALTELNHEHLSFVGGCAGFTLGCVLAALAAKVPVRRALDCFAAPLALGVTFARAAECFLGARGLDEAEGVFRSIGRYAQGQDLTEAGWTHFFPLSVPNTSYSEDMWGDAAWEQEWVLPISLHIAIFSLICVFLAVHWLRKCSGARGVAFERTVVFLCAPVFILELMRDNLSHTIFVLVQMEQILCMAAMTACILLAAVRSRKSWLGIAVPVFLLLLIIGVNAALQFGLDDKLTSFIDALPLGEAAKDWMKIHPKDWCYPGMILTDIGMLVMELILTRRQIRKEALL